MSQPDTPLEAAKYSMFRQFVRFLSPDGLKIILYKGLFLSLPFFLSFLPPLERIQGDSLIWKGVDAINMGVISRVALVTTQISVAGINRSQATLF